MGQEDFYNKNLTFPEIYENLLQNNNLPGNYNKCQAWKD